MQALDCAFQNKNHAIYYIINRSYHVVLSDTFTLACTAVILNPAWHSPLYTTPSRLPD